MQTDGLSNVVAGLGAGSAKVSAGHYTSDWCTPDVADAAFRSSTWYGKVLTIPVDDAVREWRSWQADAEQIEALEAEEKRLGYRLRVREALMIARHQGGAVVIPGGLPGDPSQPLRPDAIRKAALTFLHVLGREEITPGPIVRDPLSPLFGAPEWWEVRGASAAQVRLHPSRVVLVNGRTVPGRRLRAGEVWGDSLWAHMADAIMAADAGAAVIAALLHEAKIDVVKVPGLFDHLSTPAGEGLHIQRWQTVARLKSIANVMLLDGGTDGQGGDDWDQKQVTWTGLPDVQRVLLEVMAGAADIPVTRLIGVQQSGLSGTDSGSLRHYYDSIRARQTLDIEPMLVPLDEMLIRSALGSRPPEVWYQWRSLWQPGAKEQAEVDKMEAETAAIYAREALVPSAALEAAVQNRMVESGRWPGLEAALDEAAAEAGIEPDESVGERE